MAHERLSWDVMKMSVFKFNLFQLELVDPMTATAWESEMDL